MNNKKTSLISPTKSCRARDIRRTVGYKKVATSKRKSEKNSEPLFNDEAGENKKGGRKISC